MITYNTADAGSGSLYEFLSKSIKSDILKGVLKAGEKLPSKRQFAKNLGVSVITVENAYAQLMAEGYIYSLPKRGFYVADFKRLVQQKKPAISEEMIPLAAREGGWLADFTSNQTETGLFPFTIWSKVIREVLNDSRAQLMTNSACGGIRVLRESIAGYLREFRDMHVKPEQIVIGAGTEYLYGLLIQLFGNGKVYAVENPGYRKLEKIYHSFGAPCRWIAMDAAGICISDLEKQRADIVHITPSHQYPTGIVMPISRRYEMLGWASKAEGRYIIEDDYDSELRLSGRPIPTLQSIDMSERVIYMNTFTKTLCSTVRISYLVLPGKLLHEFYDKLSFYSCTVSNFEQYTLAKFIQEGKFENHINRLRNYYRKKRDLLLEALCKGKVKPFISVSGEEAGLHFLMKIESGVPEAVFLERARAKGVKLAPLSAYYYKEEGKPENIYVMNYSSIDITKAEEIAECIYRCCIE
ncbi:PLP-dependent aminotransferase family protein [Lachnospiraceae bacterium]|nr:PLP-dependent aminotransferase family protein [Lachnospiraceae bacterium]